MIANRVFVSYPHESESQKLKLVEQLANRFPILTDTQKIHPSQDVVQGLLAAIRESYCCILLLTEHTDKSAWCMQEAGAFLGAGKPVVPYSPGQGIKGPALFEGIKIATSVDELVTAVANLKPPPPPPPPPPPFVRQVFPYSTHGHLQVKLIDLAGKAKVIRLIGTGLQILGEAKFRDQILKRAAEHQCTLQIYLADPYSPAVEQRLIEENMGDNPLGNRLAVQKGQLGILDRAKDLASDWLVFQSRNLSLN